MGKFSAKNLGINTGVHFTEDELTPPKNIKIESNVILNTVKTPNKNDEVIENKQAKNKTRKATDMVFVSAVVSKETKKLVLEYCLNNGITENDLVVELVQHIVKTKKVVSKEEEKCDKRYTVTGKVSKELRKDLTLICLDNDVSIREAVIGAVYTKIQ